MAKTSTTASGTKLSRKQEIFAKEYAARGVGKEAAIRAGYSPKSAKTIASMLLAKPEVQEAVKEECEILAQLTRIDGKRVLDEIAAIAFCRPTDVVSVEQVTIPAGSEDPDTGAILKKDKTTTAVHIKPTDEWGELERKAISSINRSPYGGIRITFSNKLQALETLYEHLHLDSQLVSTDGAPGQNGGNGNNLLATIQTALQDMQTTGGKYVVQIGQMTAAPTPSPATPPPVDDDDGDDDLDD